jgi:ribosome maturation factor RimP
MNEDQQIKALEQMVVSLLENDPGFFLVGIKILRGNDIKVFIDADQGLGIDKLVQYNRHLYKQVEEQGLFSDVNFSLEVSSPGLEEPLKLHRQYLKNIGRYAEVLKNDGIKVEGKLLSASELEIVLEEEKGINKFNSRSGKKKELVQHIIPVDMIKTTKIQIKI